MSVRNELKLPALKLEAESLFFVPRVQMLYTGPAIALYIMQKQLLHPTHRHYTTQKIGIGGYGGFTTAPDITSVISEIRAVCNFVYLRLRRSKNFKTVSELSQKISDLVLVAGLGEYGSDSRSRLKTLLP